MTLETKAQFARRMNVSRSTVTRWDNANRLVMVGRRVDVELSIENIERTTGGRHDNFLRAQVDKEIKEVLENPRPEPEPEKTTKAKEDIRAAAAEKARNDARIKSATADKVEMERDQLAGSLIQKDDVNYVLDSFGALLRAHLDGRAERVGAETGLNPEQIAALSDSDRRLMLEIADELKKQAKTVH